MFGFQNPSFIQTRLKEPVLNMDRTGDTFLKPGSHMPPSYLRRSCWYCLRYRFDMRTEVADNRDHVGSTLPPAGLRS